ncbi:hypothetical protein SESBI_09137 [Sesbania bispinosa]|nr:hypothetical protein SESBI_09137 [Sesbania bispinosa]
MDAKQVEVKELNDQIKAKLRNSDALVQKLKMENKNLHENATRLSSERENLLAFVQGFSGKFFEFSTADTQLMDMLRSMEQSFEIGCPGMDLKKDEGDEDVEESLMSRGPRPSSPPPPSTATPMIFVINEERSLVRKEKDLKQNRRIFEKKRRVLWYE